MDVLTNIYEGIWILLQCRMYTWFDVFLTFNAFNFSYLGPGETRMFLFFSFLVGRGGRE